MGFLLLEEDEEEKELILWRIMFPEEHANRGYGGETVRAVIGLARESGKYRRMTLICHPDNHRARHLYEKMGFTPTGQVFYGENEMELTL